MLRKSQGGRARVGGLLVALVLLAAPAAAQGAITVTDTGDSGAGTLRGAITQANANPGADTIDFNVSTPATITLSSGLPAINDDLTIAGPGTTQLTVDANFSQPFVVNSGKTVTISGLTVLHGGCLTVCGGVGGSIYNSGNLTLTNVAVTESIAKTAGGGIYNAASGTLTLNSSTMSHDGINSSGGTDPVYEGGAIENQGTLHLVLSTLSNNTASASGFSGTGAAYGGGVMNAGTMTMDRSTLTENSATVTGGTSSNAHGGAIMNSGTLELTRSTIDHNHANTSGGSSFNGAFGGGIADINPASAADVTVTLDRTTLSDNSATGASESFAGGIEMYTGTYTIKSSTIASNSAQTGANVYGGGATLKNTIITSPAGGGENCSGSPFTSQGYNLSSDASCALSGAGDRESLDPMLAATLANNGGATRTYALQPTSPAIDAGLSSAGETVDQRGRNRPEDLVDIPNASGSDGSDIGAFEVQDTTPPDTIIDSGPSGITNDPTPTFTFHSTEAGSTFQCDTGGPYGFTPCTSPKTTQHLADGPHTFAVRARDVAGNTDASPAPRSFTVKTAEVQRSGSTLMITAAPGARDNLVIKKTSATQIQVTDLAGGTYTGSGIHTGPGCSRSGDYTAICTASPITAISAASGAGKDRVRNQTALKSFINGGGGDDALFGGTQRDQLTGGPGADSFQGGNGNDVLFARDLAADGAINCDGGPRPGASDQASLDKLPKDSNVSGCEVVSRH